jgi:Putative homoserine kinase type II (protein kinase fold)
MSFFNLDIPEKVMDEAVHRYIDGDYKIRILSTQMNGVFEVISDTENFIIRFSNPLKAEKHIYGEIDFIQYLYNNGVNVIKPLLSKGNSLVECVVDNHRYIITAFAKANGKVVDIYNKDEWNGSLFKRWGKIIGKMHQLTKNFTPSKEEYKRGEWNEECITAERSIFDPDLVLEPAEEIVLGKWKNLIKELSTLPKGKDCYGLVHCDLHALNFFVNCDGITVFDFDDCCYNWFSYDIAIAFYDSLYGIHFEKRSERREFLKYFSDCFFEGYNSENSLSDFWIKQIPLFINFRDYLLYMVTVTHLSASQADMQQIELLKHIRSNLENDIPIVDFDWKT